MKKSQSYFVLISVFLVLFAGTHCRANDIEKKFMRAGLVNVHAIDQSIRVDLVNSDPDKNFFRENFYNGLKKAYLREEVARKLSSAQKNLKAQFPDDSILIMDAARPRSVSRRMFDKMKGTKFEKFVADPKKGSMHNYGIAVDVTIVNGNGKEIDMGFTPFYKSDLSIYWGYAKLKLFHLSDTQKNNRALLAKVMKNAGFIPLSYEWWHFNGIPKGEARRKYSIIE
jgi:D-alanyl-D-alanine dipeptidase